MGYTFAVSEYEVSAEVLVPMKILHKILAMNSEEAEEKFLHLIEREGIEFVYQWDSNLFTAVEVVGVFSVEPTGTSQER